MATFTELEPPVLSLQQVTKRYDLKEGQLTAVEDISFVARRGEIVAVLGPSGCGKTTLLEMVAGLLQASEGRVLVHGRPVTGPSTRVGVVFQQDSTLPWRTVLSNIAFGMEMTRVSKPKARERASLMLELIGLTGFGNVYPHQLSGGMRQRVAIGRVLAMEPELIVMDEPFGALDEQTRLRLGLELIKLVRRTGTTVLLVTHSIQEAALLAERVVLLSARPGRIQNQFEVPISKPRSLNTLASSEYSDFTHVLWTALVDIEKAQPQPARVAIR
jgi:NitT/TauT family transport system ATP-binding protein